MISVLMSNSLSYIFNWDNIILRLVIAFKILCHENATIILVSLWLVPIKFNYV